MNNYASSANAGSTALLFFHSTRGEPFRLAAPFEYGGAEVNVIDVQREALQPDIDPLHASRFARLPGQVVLDVVHDRQPAEHRVAVRDAADRALDRHAHASVVDGARLAMLSATMKDGQLLVKMPSGLELPLELGTISRLDYSTGKIVFLSDLEPQSASYVPLVAAKEDLPALAEYYHYRRDQGFDGKPLTTELSGNVIDVCPVGALTNKVFRFKARAWALVGDGPMARSTRPNQGRNLAGISGTEPSSVLQLRSARRQGLPFFAGGLGEDEERRALVPYQGRLAATRCRYQVVTRGRWQGRGFL